HGADAGDLELFAAHVRVEWVEHERGDQLAADLAHAHVLRLEAGVIGVEVAPRFGAGDAVRAQRQVHQRVHVRASRGAVDEPVRRVRALLARAATGARLARGPRPAFLTHSRASRVRNNAARPFRARVMPGPRKARPSPIARSTSALCQSGSKCPSSSRWYSPRGSGPFSPSNGG